MIDPITRISVRDGKVYILRQRRASYSDYLSPSKASLWRISQATYNALKRDPSAEFFTYPDGWSVQFPQNGG